MLEAFRSRAKQNGKENSYSVDYETIKALQALAAELHIAILIIHHLRKGADEGDPIDKISGTLGLSGGADMVLIIDSNATGRTLYGRGRDLEEIDQAIRFNRETCRWEILGEANDVRRSSERGMILECLKDAEATMTPIQISTETGLKRAAVRKLLLKMVTDGDVLKGARARYYHPDNSHFEGAKTK